MKPNIKIYRDIEQRTNEWLEIKKAKVSGSGVKPIFSSRTKGPLDTYAYKLIGQAEDTTPLVYAMGYLNAAVQWGVDMEEHAVKAFEDKYLKITEEVGWVESEDPKLKGRHGCSPDGIIDIWSWIEIKCLNTANHLAYVAANKVPTEFKPQIINYFVTNKDLQIVYFILYDPRVKTKHLQLHVVEVSRESVADEIKEGYDKIVKFLDYKDELYNSLKGPKTCRKCKDDKSRSEFGKSARAKDGLLGVCKKCRTKNRKK